MNTLGAGMPIIQPPVRRVLDWRDADQPLDFTPNDDARRVPRVAGDTVTARQIAATPSELDGRRRRPLRAGGLGALDLMIRVAKVLAPGGADPFPPWQGMQHMRDMFSGEGRLAPPPVLAAPPGVLRDGAGDGREGAM